MHRVPDALLRRQAGIVARTQLVELRWSASAIGRAISAQRLIPVAQGVYRAAGVTWTRRASRVAALLIAGPHAALAGWSAGELHGFTDARPGPLQVVVPGDRRTSARAPSLVRVRRSTNLLHCDVQELGELRLTTGARTLLDLAAQVRSVEQLAELTATAVRVGATDLGSVEAVVTRCPRARGRRGLLDAIALLGNDGTAARSEVEIAALGAIVGAGLPRPLLAHRVLDDTGAFVAEVDLAYPDLRIAIEIDGYRWHSTPAQKRRDEQRQNRLILLGWRVLRFSASEVRRHPARVAALVRQAVLHSVK